MQDISDVLTGMNIGICAFVILTGDEGDKESIVESLKDTVRQHIGNIAVPNVIQAMHGMKHTVVIWVHECM